VTLRPRTTTCSSALTPHWRNLRQAQSVSRSYRRCRTRFSRVAVAQCASHPSKSMTLWRRCLAGTTFTALASQSGLRSASGRARCARARQSLHDSGSKEVRECPRDSPGDHILPIVCITQLVYIAYRPTLRWSSHHQPDRPQRESVSRCEAGAVSISLSTKSSFGPHLSHFQCADCSLAGKFRLPAPFALTSRAHRGKREGRAFCKGTFRISGAKEGVIACTQSRRGLVGNSAEGSSQECGCRAQRRFCCTFLVVRTKFVRHCSPS